MARRKIGKRTEVKIDLANYLYLLNGVAGIGKTTTVCEIGVKEFGEDGFILLTLGKEPKPTHIGGVLADSAKDWDELEEIVEALVDDRDTEYKDVKMIALDSVDELFRLCEKHVVGLHNKKVTNPSDKIKTIKQSFGGFQAGENMVVNLVCDKIFELTDAGYSLFFIGHTKQKNKKDLYTEIEYEQITSNLENKYYNAIKDKVNIVMCAYMEREMADISVQKDAFTKKDKEVGRIVSEKRIVTFRDDDYAMDVKSHLKHIVPKCELDSDVIIHELKEAMRKQYESYHSTPLTKSQLEEKALADREKMMEEAKIAKEEKANKEADGDKEEKMAKITSNLDKLDLAKIQDIMVRYKISDFSDVDNIPMDAVNEMYELIK